MAGGFTACHCFIRAKIENILMIYMGNFLPSGRIIFLLVIFLPLLVSFANAEESKKLVAFDYAIADTLSALQQPPLAMAGLAQYRRFYREPLLPDTRELGNRFQPNFEYLASLEPDAILISPPAHLNLENKLSSIADVIKISLFGENLNIWQNLEQLTRKVGELNDQQQQAQELIESVQTRLAVIAAQIARPVDPLLVVEIRDDRHVRIYGHGSLEDMVITQLGLENAWQGPTNDWGFSTLTISEAFQLEGRFILLHPTYSQYLTDSALPTSGLWQHWLDDTPVNIEVNYWPWGGFPSALRFAESLVEALEAQAPPNAAG
ncbi:ABC transporter substrate-binding protein [Vreelandella titanicae]|uniref:ABC transporter substrate-binding protein n=1 Tax=Vreelandella titanicae TaxID=664683 RepID=UPI003D085DC2|nr:ABC transporter substrate-binding protein [Halomonas profundus]|tara:strand:+ start:414 stop:1373 length:960 start_codon:yes stop_codon:yes gene_type:complete